MKRLFLFFVTTLFFVSCTDGPRGIVFKKTDYKDKWPFSVDEIDVFCAGIAKSEIYFQAGDKVYALNGDAQTKAENRTSAETFETFKEVWLDDPKQPGSKILVPSEFIQKAFENCDK